MSELHKFLEFQTGESAAQTAIIVEVELRVPAEFHPPEISKPDT